MVLAAGSLWVTGRGTDLLRVDPATGAVQATIEIGAGGIDVREAGGSIWVAAPTDEEDRRGNPFLDRLLRVDPSANAIMETVRPTGHVVVTGTASTGSAFWIADTASGRLYRVSRWEGLAERCSSSGRDARSEARTQGVPVSVRYGGD